MEAEAQVEVARRFAGPPGIGHGGYVAGLFATGPGGGAVQVTLHRPTPLDTTLSQISGPGGTGALKDGDTLLVSAAPAELQLEVPRPPTVEAAEGAAPASPSHRGGRGVHPTCFGCSVVRPEGDGLRIAAGRLEVDGVTQVAARWTPARSLAEVGAPVSPRFVVAALDCPGAFAHIVEGEPAGLLGRLTFDQSKDVWPGVKYVVTGWTIGVEGRKLRAGTALFTADGELVARAAAIWFPMPTRD